jgi:uncharacterized protein (DUF1800 family)
MPTQSDTEHLLRRTEFVARPGRVNELLPLTHQQAVDNVLAVDTSATTPAYLVAYPGEEGGWDQYIDACAWWIHVMANRPRPFLEKMVLFWHGHLVSAWGDVDGGFRLMRQLQTYRANALGNYVTLAQAMAIDPAMLVYLSNAENRIYTWTDGNGVKHYDGDPNQNFARELMELFTLGVGNYTEDDVEAAASAWTGYNADWDEDPLLSRPYAFSAERHDDRPKTFFGHTRAWTGPETIQEILQGTYSGRTDKRALAARRMATKLWEFLAHPGPPAGVIDGVLSESNFAATMNIRELVRAILLRPEFYSSTAKQGLVRTPIEYLAAIAYHTGLIPDPSTVPPDPPGGVPDGELTRGDKVDPLGISWRSESTGQQLFHPPNVSGWRPNGYWLSTGALSGRAAFARSVAWRLQQPGRHFAEGEPGDDAVRQGTPSAAVDYVANYFGLASLSTTSRNAILTTHTADRGSVAWWAWYTVGNLLTMTMLTPEFHMA